VKDVLATLERWTAEGVRAAYATVVQIERSAPRGPGAVMAVSERGEVAGSVTGGCVEPAVYAECEAVLGGEPPRLRTYGITDDEGFEVGLACGGTVHIFIEALDPSILPVVARAVADDTPLALVTRIAGETLGGAHIVTPNDAPPVVAGMLARGETGRVSVGQEEIFVSSIVPRPNMYVFGAIDHAAAVARIGHFLGYRVTVCDARETFVTKERYPDVDELVVAWPHEFLARSPVDERTAICVLTHDPKFDVPALKVALESPAGYIGAMGSRRTTEKRAERLRADGVSDEAMARIHAPIGISIAARTPEEVAVSVAAEIVRTMHANQAAAGAKAAA
jgi:xanthine dehydrogenase accessory factor